MGHAEKHGQWKVARERKKMLGLVLAYMVKRVIYVLLTIGSTRLSCKRHFWPSAPQLPSSYGGFVGSLDGDAAEFRVSSSIHRC